MPVIPDKEILGSPAYLDSPARGDPRSRAAAWVLATTLAVVPVVGMPNELVLQDTLKSTLLAGGVLLAALVWVAGALRRTIGGRVQGELRWHGLLALPLVLCLYALGSMVWSHTYLAGVEAARWALLGMLLWSALNVLRRDTVPLLVWGVQAGAVGASAWAAAQFWGDVAWFPQAAMPASTFVNRNFFAEYLVCTLPFSIYALAQLQTPRWRLWMALSLAFNVVALMMTGTRSALVALLLMGPLLVYALWRYRSVLTWGQWSRSSQLSVTLTFLAGVLLMGSIPSPNTALVAEGHGATPLQRGLLRTSSMALPAEYSVGSFSIRASMWKSTARMVMDKPWTGVGAGAWEVHILLYQGWNNSVETDFYAHNEYLQLLGEYGLPIGGGVLAVLFAYLLFSAQRIWQMPTTGEGGSTAVLRAVALCSLLALLIVSNAGFPWRLASTGALFMVALALLTAESAPRHAVSYRSLQVGLGILLIACVLALLLAVQAMRAESLIIRSVHTLNAVLLRPDMPTAERAEAQKKAFALLKEGVGINPHYRKLTARAADQFAATGNLDAALWAQESVAASRPYIPDIQANLVLLNSGLHHAQAALRAMAALEALQPDAPRTRALGILLLRRSGNDTEAAARLQTYFAQGHAEYDLVRFALAIGLDHHDRALTVQALRLWMQGWPGEAAAQANALKQLPETWRTDLQN
jgi:O-antigen ligase